MKLPRWSWLFPLWTVLAGSQTVTESGLPPEVLLLARIKRHMVDTLDRLPAYACLENVDRLVRESPKKPIHGLDALRLEIIVIHGKELFSWPGDESTFSDAMPIPGLNSTGEFFALADAIFARDSSAVIKYRGEETLAGARAARYDYTLSSLFFHNELSVDGREATVGSGGSFWADPATAGLLRLIEQVQDIPPDLDTLAVTTTIDYTRLLLAGKPFLFPQTSVVTLVRASGAESQNRIEFTQCREYRVESHLSSADVGVAPTPAPIPAPTTIEFQIPPDVDFPVSLSDAIELTHVRVGDPIRGVLDSNITHKREAIAPKGALLTGRVRMLTHNHEEGESFLTIGCEFTDLSFTDSSGARHHAPFYAFLRDFSTLPGVSRQITHTNVQQEYGIGFSLAEHDETESVTPPVLPGVATFFVEDGRASLPKGFVIDWVSARFPHNR